MNDSLGALCAVLHTHVDDMMLACLKGSSVVLSAMKHLVSQLRLVKQVGDSLVYCGRTLVISPDAILVHQAKAAQSVDSIPLPKDGRALDAKLTVEETSLYRSVLGQLL